MRFSLSLIFLNSPTIVFPSHSARDRLTGLVFATLNSLISRLSSLMFSVHAMGGQCQEQVDSSSDGQSDEEDD